MFALLGYTHLHFHFKIIRYVIVITKIVIPDAFWGSQENFKLIMKSGLSLWTFNNCLQPLAIKELVISRRFESLTLHNVVQGFSTSACDWLMPPGSGANQMRVPATDFFKRRELLEDFLYWYFDSFVLSLLKVNNALFVSLGFIIVSGHLLYHRLVSISTTNAILSS